MLFKWSLTGSPRVETSNTGKAALGSPLGLRTFCSAFPGTLSSTLVVPTYLQSLPWDKLQGQVLDLAGPLTCLWADLLKADAKVKREDVLLLVQWILVLLGSLANLITQERRQILWLR